MCKLYLSTVEIQCGPGGQPFSFQWKNHWHLIETGYIYEIPRHHWKWYRDMGLDPYKARYRCRTDCGLECDLVEQKNAWILERVWD